MAIMNMLYYEIRSCYNKIGVICFDRPWVKIKNCTSKQEYQIFATPDCANRKTCWMFTQEQIYLKNFIILMLVSFLGLPSAYNHDDYLSPIKVKIHKRIPT